MQFDGKTYKNLSFKSHIDHTTNNSQTLQQLFLNRVKESPSANCFGRIVASTLQWYTNLESLEMIAKLAKFLEKKVEKNQIHGIFSINRYEWIVAEQAIYALNGITCPLYATFGVDAVRHVLSQTGMEVCFCSGPTANFLFENLYQKKDVEKTENSDAEILRAYTGKGKNFDLKLKTLVVFDDFKYDAQFKEIGLEIFYLTDILENTEIDNPIEFSEKCELGPDDLATICYTSGTSGLPKGVELTHTNFISSVAAFFMGEGDNSYYELRKDAVYMSYLPLAHVMERLCINVVLQSGAAVGFYGGDIKNIASDYKVIKPTFIIGVPRVFSLFKENIEKTVRKKGIFSRIVFSLGLRWKIFMQKFGCVDSFLDSFIFNKVKIQFGGNLEACLCGSAPIEPHVVRFLQAALSCKIFQGYGSSETTAACIVAPINLRNVDTVGVPFPSNEIKLAPCDEEVYRGKFEIRVRGSNVFRGYFKNESATFDAFDSEGFFKTGDLGVVDGNGFKIIGRKKEIFKTSQGEYIVPEKIEGILKCDGIDDILVTGKSDKRFIVGIIVCLDSSISDQAAIERVKKVGMNAVSENALMKYEVPQRFAVLRKEFKCLGDVVTPTMKKKRALLEFYLRKTVGKLYDE